MNSEFEKLESVGDSVSFEDDLQEEVLAALEEWRRQNADKSYEVVYDGRLYVRRTR
jgi:hypothetical protein